MKVICNSGSGVKDGGLGQHHLDQEPQREEQQQSCECEGRSTCSPKQRAGVKGGHMSRREGSPVLARFLDCQNADVEFLFLM